MRMRETSEGTSSYTVRFVLRHFVANERFARRYRNEPSPGILLTLPFSGIFQGFSARYSHSNHSQDHGQWQVCMCVCVCVVVYCVCCVLCCAIFKTGSNHGHNVVRKCEKTQEITGKLSKHGLHLWHGMATHGPKKGPKTAIFPDALFLRVPWDLPTFSAEGPIPNAQKRRF